MREKRIYKPYSAHIILTILKIFPQKWRVNQSLMAPKWSLFVHHSHQTKAKSLTY